MTDPAGIDPRLEAHLATWLGAWPPTSGVHIVGHGARVRPGWDGAIHDCIGVAAPGVGAVVSVPPATAGPLTAAIDAAGLRDVDLTEAAARAALAPLVADAFGRHGAALGAGVFRWSTVSTPGDDPGIWLPADDVRLPTWLRPFNGDVLVALVGGAVAAGVGRKIHDAHGHELAVVTEEAFRGQGFARRLVTQAARRVSADHAIPTYLHAPGNTASAHTAEASGFPDRGWKILGLFGDPGPQGSTASVPRSESA